MAIRVYCTYRGEYEVLINGKDAEKLDAIAINRDMIRDTALATVIDRGLVELDAEGRPAEKPEAAGGKDL